jgi:hypothetical protein
LLCLLVSSLKKLNIKIYKTITLPAVLYGCETSSLTIREEHVEGVGEQGAENTWTEEAGNGRRLMKTK